MPNQNLLLRHILALFQTGDLDIIPLAEPVAGEQGCAMATTLQLIRKELGSMSFFQVQIFLAFYRQ